MLAEWGWLNFFWLCALLAAPGMLLLVKIAPWQESGQAGPAAEPAPMAGEPTKDIAARASEGVSKDANKAATPAASQAAANDVR